MSEDEDATPDDVDDVDAEEPDDVNDSDTEEPDAIDDVDTEEPGDVADNGATSEEATTDDSAVPDSDTESDGADATTGDDAVAADSETTDASGETLVDDVDREQSDEEATVDEGDEASATADTVESGTVTETADPATTQGEATSDDVSDGMAILGALVSFFIIPGLGNLMVDETDRGLILAGLYIAWVVVVWGIGFFIILSIITIVTLGLGGILQLIAGLVLMLVEFVIRAVTAYDVYENTSVVDSIVGKVNEMRS